MFLVKAYHYRIKSTFAMRQKRPAAFIAIKLSETDRAVHLYGKAKNQLVDGWFPKRAILSCVQTNQHIDPPENILNREKGKQQRNAVIYRDVIEVRFPFDNSLVQAIKTLPGRWFNIQDPQDKHWNCPLSYTAIKILRVLGFSLSFPKVSQEDGTYDQITDWFSAELKDIAKPIRRLNFEGLNVELRQYQKDGVRMIDNLNGNALLADEMGLGKTIQALAWLWLHPQKRPAVIVCPGGLKMTWKYEIRKVLKGTRTKVKVLNGRQGNSDLKADIFIINYDILSNKFETVGKGIREIKYTGWVDYLKDLDPQVVIVEECHKIAHHKTKRTEAVTKLRKGVPHFILISGTPITIRPVQFYTPLKLLDPFCIPSWQTFVKKYCAGKKTGFGWDANGASNMTELFEILKNIMIRRLKKDVWEDMPEKNRAIVPLKITNRQEYRSAQDNFLEYIQRTQGQEKMDKAEGAEQLVQMSHLKQLAAEGKMKAVIEWIDNFLESGEKLVVFAVHKKVISTLVEKYSKICVKIDGDVPVNQRKAMEQKFQNNPDIRLIFVNYEAGGTGFTLTAASNVALTEYPWSPGEVEQAIDRVHRIGQKDGVTAYYLMAIKTIEEELIELLINRGKQLANIMDGTPVGDNTLYQDLFEKFKNAVK